MCVSTYECMWVCVYVHICVKVIYHGFRLEVFVKIGQRAIFMETICRVCF